jgi:hypothetical protein
MLIGVWYLYQVSDPEGNMIDDKTTLDQVTSQEELERSVATRVKEGLFVVSCGTQAFVYEKPEPAIECFFKIGIELIGICHDIPSEQAVPCSVVTVTNTVTGIPGLGMVAAGGDLIENPDIFCILSGLTRDEFNRYNPHQSSEDKVQ